MSCKLKRTVSKPLVFLQGVVNEGNALIRKNSHNPSSRIPAPRGPRFYPWVNWPSGAGCSPPRDGWSGAPGLLVRLHFPAGQANLNPLCLHPARQKSMNPRSPSVPVSSSYLGLFKNLPFYKRTFWPFLLQSYKAPQ